MAHSRHLVTTTTTTNTNHNARILLIRTVRGLQTPRFAVSGLLRAPQMVFQMLGNYEEPAWVCSSLRDTSSTSFKNWHPVGAFGDSGLGTMIAGTRSHYNHLYLKRLGIWGHQNSQASPQLCAFSAGYLPVMWVPRKNQPTKKNPKGDWNYILRSSAGNWVWDLHSPVETRFYQSHRRTEFLSR